MSTPFNTYTHPSANNVYVPNYDASLNLLVSFIRDPKKFKINEWATFSTVTKPRGVFPRIYAGDSVRVSVEDMVDMAWPDGQLRPRGSQGGDTSRFSNDNYFAQRYSRSKTLGARTLEYAEWDIKTVERQSLAAKFMTAVTKFTIDTLFDTAQYPSNHVRTASSLGGGFWSAGTTTNPIIKNTLFRVRDRILLDTNGLVSVENLCLVMNPTTAGLIASSQEMFTYLAQQAGSLAVLSGDDPNIKDAWGLPKNLHGFKVIVDDSVVVTQKERDVQDTPTYLFPDNQVAVVAAPGSIGNFATSGFSTIHCLEVKGQQMVVMEKMDDFHQVLDIAMSHEFTPFLVAPETGFIITNLFN